MEDMILIESSCDFYHTSTFSPWLPQAPGDMVVVGGEVKYLQRNAVDHHEVAILMQSKIFGEKYSRYATVS